MSTDEPRAYCEQCKRRHPPHEHAAFDDDAEVSCGRELSAVRLELQAVVRERDYLREEVNRMGRVLRDMGQWEEFCHMYGKRYPIVAVTRWEPITNTEDTDA